MDDAVIEQLKQFISEGRDFAAYHLAKDIAHWGLQMLWLNQCAGMNRKCGEI
jgi:hypothetical protein